MSRLLEIDADAQADNPRFKNSVLVEHQDGSKFDLKHAFIALREGGMVGIITEHCGVLLFHQGDLEQLEERLPEKMTGTTPIEHAKRLCKMDPHSSADEHLDAILEAEDLGFDASDCRRVMPHLFEFAFEYRRADESWMRHVVQSAIRTAGSMLWPQDAGRLKPFISGDVDMGVMKTAIKMLGRVFEANPPANIDQHEDLATICLNNLQVLLFGANERPDDFDAELACMIDLNALAMAAMGSQRTLTAIETIKSVPGSTCATALRRLRHELNELLTYPRFAPRSRVEHTFLIQNCLKLIGG